MAFYHDSNHLERVVWYFVPNDRPPLPYASPFASRTWDIREPDPQPALGERYSPRPWRGGQAPAEVPTGGLCGSQSQWEQGASINDPLPAKWAGTNIPVCCPRPPVMDVGGLAVGGADYLGLPSLGGLVAGGRDYVYAYDNDKGGLTVGGADQVVSVNQYAGGLVVGGEDFIGEPVADLGGLVVGGEDFIAGPTTDLGGLVVGGEDFITDSLPPDVGGVAVGGEDTLWGFMQDVGGLVAGGDDVIVSGVALDVGGLAAGGSDAIGQTRIYISGCNNVWKNTLKLTVGGAGCSCLPGTINFDYNPANGRWESITNSSACTGTNTINWYFTYSATGNKFVLWDTVANRDLPITNCGTRQAGGNVTVVGGYCGTGTHTYGAGITER